MTEYEDLRAKDVAEYARLMPAYVATAYASPEAIRGERERRLRHFLEVATERSPWHARRLAGVRAASFLESGLGSIPPMTKQDLMQNFNDILTDKRLSRRLVEDHLDRLADDAYLLDEFHAVASGGSSGVRGVFVYDWDGWRWSAMTMQRFRARAMANLGIGPEARRAAVAGGKASHMSFAQARCFGGATNMVPVPATLPKAELVARLNEIQPAVISGFPSMIVALAHEQAAGRLAVSPRLIVCASEPLLPEMRDTITATWGAPVINSYATSEGAFASDCGAGMGMHLNEDVCIFEPVDDQYRSVPPGTTAPKVLVTPLYNIVQPLIRYEITDEIKILTEPCPCGSAMRLIADVGGRSDDLFRYGEVTVHPMTFRSPLGRQRNIIEYQVYQTVEGADIDIRAEGDVPLAELAVQVAQALEALGVQRPTVNLRRVDGFSRQATGKLRRFVPRS